MRPDFGLSCADAIMVNSTVANKNERIRFIVYVIIIVF
jgi:hypothetical protein